MRVESRCGATINENGGVGFWAPTAASAVGGHEGAVSHQASLALQHPIALPKRDTQRRYRERAGTGK